MSHHGLVLALAALAPSLAACPSPNGPATAPPEPPVATPAPGGAPSASPAASAGAAERTRIQIRRKDDVPYELLAVMPAGMSPSRLADGKPQNSRWHGDEEADDVSTEAWFRIECQGCAPEEIRARMAGYLAEKRRNAEQPYAGTASDHIRGTIEILAEEVSPHGASVLAFVARYPRAPETPWVIGDQLSVFCIAHRPGDDGFVEGFARAGASASDRWLPSMLEMCRTMELVGPAAP